MSLFLEARNLIKVYKVGKKDFRAVDDVSFSMHRGETLGLVGESGCGKSTLGRMLLRLIAPTSGQIYFKGEEITTRKSKELCRQIQIIFQDPYASLNPRMPVGEIIREPLLIHNLPNRVDELLDLVNLPRSIKNRYPHEFSGGQRQRIGIARALALNPEFIVCDEPISALDLSIQSQIVSLLMRLQKEFYLTYLFIAHDLAMVKYISTRIAVMYLGRFVELGTTDEVYTHPLHPYTQLLLASIPSPNPLIERSRPKIRIQGEVPPLSAERKGCAFCKRCPKAIPVCEEKIPDLREVKPGHFVACHLYDV